MDRSHEQTGQCFRQYTNSSRINNKECKLSQQQQYQNSQQLQPDDIHSKNIILSKTLIKSTGDFSSSRNSSIFNNTNVASNKEILPIKRIPKDQSSRKKHEIIVDNLKQKNKILYNKYKIIRSAPLATTSKSTSVSENASETNKEDITGEQLQEVNKIIELKMPSTSNKKSNQMKLHSLNFYRKVNRVSVDGDKKENGDKTIRKTIDSSREYFNRSTVVHKNPGRKVHMVANNTNTFQQIKKRYSLINNKPNVSSHVHTSNVIANSTNKQNSKTT